MNNLDELKDLLDLLSKYEVNEFGIESEGRKLHLSMKQNAPAGPAGIAVLPGSGLPLAVPSLPHPPASAQAQSPGEAREGLPPGVKAVTSPMVGTFYRAPSPEADPFVQVGDRVEEDTVICIIEAMKVMNEIQAGVAGVIKDILVKNGESVEFGQPLVHLQTQ
ncbi:MAG: acetyl-CoA carboxylase biotin carboxyl carrier protein [Planctomycetes bacterium]|nr:acetyl-CoA carboxylase biotin carboxyl carrier protein [Planctomycetota bacterium]